MSALWLKRVGAPCADSSDRPGDHGVGHQWFRHTRAHSVRRQHRREQVHHPGLPYGDSAARRRYKLIINDEQSSCFHSVLPHMIWFIQVIVLVGLFSQTISFHSHTASLHPRRPGLTHCALLPGRPLRGHHDGGGRGHHVCAENRLLHGEDAPASPAETHHPCCEQTQVIGCVSMTSSIA